MEIDNNRIASLVTQLNAQDASVAKPENGSTRDTAAPAATSPDRASFTATARQLQELAAAIEQAPAVDSRRVETVRTAVENGSFAVDPTRIAEKMMSLEQALTDTR
ncbi:MAG TPA: flagellar biosynthesis anti-sigma factor FlgM [Gammaproteobacteria bacterium]|nr:flagellar biosynthesis anti-sigma factor FlgM [Gammaproteobacteria bacterium]